MFASPDLRRFCACFRPVTSNARSSTVTSLFSPFHEVTGPWTSRMQGSATAYLIPSCLYASLQDQINADKGLRGLGLKPPPCSRWPVQGCVEGGPSKVVSRHHLGRARARAPDLQCMPPRCTTQANTAIVPSTRDSRPCDASKAISRGVTSPTPVHSCIAGHQRVNGSRTLAPAPHPRPEARKTRNQGHWPCRA